MSPLRTNLMMKIIDGDHRIPPLMYNFDRLVRCDELLKWLVNNNLTGVNFLGFLLENSNSFLQTAAEITRRVDKDKICKPIFAGRDFIT